MNDTARRTSRRRSTAGLALALASVVAACGGADTGDDRADARSSAASTTAPPDSSPTTAPPTTAPSSTTAPAAAPSDAGMPRGTPARIAIPAIGVDAPVVDLNRNADGTLEVPDWQDAGWWRRGPEPGERGPAVIVGHVDSQAGPAVFSRLEELAAGDVVEVGLDTGGDPSRYVVERTERFAKDAFPTRDVYELTDGPELRLITCDGEFDESTGHYVDNLVVFATPA